MEKILSPLRVRPVPHIQHGYVNALRLRENTAGLLYFLLPYNKWKTKKQHNTNVSIEIFK